jgi:hypothetical protein
MSNKYNSDDIAATLNVTKRTAQRYIENLLSKDNGQFYFEKDVFDLIIERHTNDIQTTETDTDGINEFFTQDQYREFQKRLIEYPMFKKHIEAMQEEISYHKQQYETLMGLHKEFMQMHKSLQEKSYDNLTQRSWIEAKEKGLDTV